LTHHVVLKMVPLGLKVGLGLSDIVWDGDPALPTERGTAAQPPLFAHPYFVAKRLDRSGYHLVRR